MKAKYKLVVLLSAMLSFGLVGCSDDDNNDNLGVEVPEMALKEEAIEIKIRNEVSVDITEGGGEYKAFSLNEDIATVALVDNKLKVQGLKVGKTSLIISDNDNCYQRLPVEVYVDALLLEKQEVALNFPLGQSKTVVINILEGNGSYTVSSDNVIVVASVANSKVTLKAIGQAGDAKVTVTDARGLQAVIQVKAAASTIPYDEAELTAIKADATLRYDFNGNVEKNDETYYTLLNKMEGEFNLYGWDYYNYNYLKVYFPGDKTVGEKSGSKLTYKNSGPTFTNEPIKFEIIKNDGTKIWATYSFIKNEKLNFGHFCQNINP